MLNEQEKATIKSYAEKGIGLRVLYQTEKGADIRKYVLHYEGNEVSDKQLAEWGFNKDAKVDLGSSFNVYFDGSKRNQEVLSQFLLHRGLSDTYRLRNTTCTAKELADLTRSKDITPEILFLALTEEPVRKFVQKNGADIYAADNSDKCFGTREYLKKNPDVLKVMRACTTKISTEAYNYQMWALKGLTKVYE